MKRKLFLTLLSVLSCIAVSAQQDAEYWFKRYQTQVRNLGPAGVGVETIIDRWEEAAPEDPRVFHARFAFALTKGQSSNIVCKEGRTRYLGKRPCLTLKDSLGRDVNYFEEVSYDDTFFALALKSIDKACQLDPLELRYEFDRIAALFSYEKESPDLALAQIRALLARETASHPDWKLDGEPAPEGAVEQAMQEFCYSIYNIGSPQAYEHFYSLSTELGKCYRNNSSFVSNQGTYWLVAKDNPKKARSFYKKALKINPEDIAAKSNLELIQSLQSRKDRRSK